MKVFIIGSEGFIGSHCVDHFINKGCEVYGVDLVHVPHTNYHYKKVFPQETRHEEVFKSIRPDICINATGSANVNLSIQQPVSDFEANTVYIFHVLNSIRLHCPECRFVNISSAAVYGNPVSLPVTESSAIAPISPYGWHKFFGEQICREFSAIYGLRTCSVRPFSVFGPGQNKLLFWDIYEKSKRNDIIELFGTGNETRDFIYIDDLAEAVEIISRKAAMAGEAYNAGCGSQVSIREAADLFLQVLDQGKTARFNNSVRGGDPAMWQASVDELLKLGFTPKVSLTAGLKNYTEWLRENA